jgi:Ca2+-binding RTX toxin-like protein
VLQSQIEVLTPANADGTEAYDFTGSIFSQYVYGNAGNNRIDGGGGGDILVGRGGDDILVVRNAVDQIREDVGGGSDRVFAFVSWQLNAGAQVELITTDDNLGSAAINLHGNEFAQYVYGNAGDNTIGGGAGRDVLNGLGGHDQFLFDTALNTAFTASFASLGESANVDRIDGFGTDDKIALSGSQFGLTPGALPAGAFNTGTTATEADDRILYDVGSGALLFDADGAGGAAAQLIGYISGPFNLDASYIVVV